MKNENWRFITPILVTIAIAINGIVLSVVSDTNQKLFKHLTNDELHCPRSVVVSKAEFAIYQEMRQRQMEGVREDINARITNLTKSIDTAIDAMGKSCANRM